MTSRVFKEKIYQKKGLIFRIALRMLNNRQDAEDATSEAIVKLWLKRDQLHRYRELDGFIFTVIKNQCLDHIRARKYHMSLDHETLLYSNSFHNADEPGATKTEQVEAIIRTLPEKQQLMLHLRMTEGFSMQKIADVMNEKVNTVEVTLSRARKKIRNEYENKRN